MSLIEAIFMNELTSLYHGIVLKTFTLTQEDINQLNTTDKVMRK